MRRRMFIRLLGGVAAAWPLASRPQQSAVPAIGFLRITPLGDAAHIVAAFRQGLAETGYVEGRNVSVEYRSAEGQLDRSRALATEFVQRPMAVIVGETVSALASKAATATVPIVFTTGSDPVGIGLVTSLNRPGGNVTGVVFFNSVLGAKRLELLRQLVPRAKTIAMLVNRNFPNFVTERSDVQAAAQAIGYQLIVTDVSTVRDVQTAFADFVKRDAGALFVGSGAFFNSNREYVVSLAALHRLPASYSWREAAVAGGLMSYGASQTDAYRQAGIYAGRILKGEKPGDLPVMRSTKFEFVLNLKTAKTLDLEIPPTLLALADEVIE